MNTRNICSTAPTVPRVEATRPTNTEYERLALCGSINLSDGHARHGNINEQRALLRTSADWFASALHRPQMDVENEFLRAFFDCAKQEMPKDSSSVFLSYSSSCAMKMAAQFCRLHGLTVHLVEPCFDSIRHLLLTEGVEVHALPEVDLTHLDRHPEIFQLDHAIWLVMPNNPTGFCLDELAFRQLIECASNREVTLIVDFCFRFFAPSLATWDQYHAFRGQHLRYISIEDTGKTWAFADTKVGITVCSPECQTTIHRLHDELLLNVSPYHLSLLTAMIQRSISHGLDVTVRAEIESNRQLVSALIEKGLVRRASESCGNVPMEFLELPHSISATSFWSRLRERGVDVLPAHNYYWTNREIGDSRFRIPLSRPHSDFQAAIPIILTTLLEMARR